MIGAQLFRNVGPTFPLVVIEAKDWKYWEDRFIAVVIDHHCYRFHKNGSYTVVDPDGELNELTSWGMERIIRTMFVDDADFLHHFCVTLPSAGSFGWWEIATPVFKALRSSTRVKTQIKAVLQLKAVEEANALDKVRQLLMMEIRIEIDHMYGLAPTFVCPSENSKELYLMYGEKMYYIKDVTRPEGTLIGSLCD